MNIPEDPISELSGAEVRHCTAAFAHERADAWKGADTLPYADLGGRGFERLCFELLLAQGYEPRFFGRSGQPQPEIDLLAIKDGQTEVFSCKNLAKPITEGLLRERLAEFESRWIDGWVLRKPSRFVICWPQPFRDVNLEATWDSLKRDFTDRTGVDADIWHLDLLNGWLKKLPDVVSDLFSNRHAEDFCDLDEWLQDQFIALQEGASGNLSLKRFFERQSSDRLFVDDDLSAKIIEVMERSPVILLRGLPGAGKTLAALAVAQRYRDGRFRAWFVDLADKELGRAQILEGIRQRIRARPSVFVLENCHSRPADVERVLGNLGTELESGRVRVMCLARRVPGDLRSRSDESDLYDRMEAEDAVVDLDVDDRRLQQFVEFWRNDLSGLSGKRVARLRALCGGNLLLLDELLQHSQKPEEIDTLEISELYDRIRSQYFLGNTADDLSQTRRLAALAQFEIRPRVDVLEIPVSEIKLIESLSVKGGTPPRWHLLHSGAAELILHALWSGMGVAGPRKVAEQAAQDILDYLKAAANPNLRPLESPESLEQALVALLRNRLTLGAEGESALKAIVLDSETVSTLVPKLEDLPGYPLTVALAKSVAGAVGADVCPWISRMQAAARRLAASWEDLKLSDIVTELAARLRLLRVVDAALLEQVCRGIDPRRFLSRLERDGTVFELFKVVENASPGFARELVDTLDDDLVRTLVEKTIKAGRSIGTLHLALFTLRRNEDTRSIGEDLERKIGARRLLDLIVANGTVFELFRAVQYAGPGLARELVDALDDDLVHTLVEKTIRVGRSIGTLNLALFTLRRNEDTRAIGEDLERKIGARRLLDLIVANGTVFELFMVVGHASPGLARELVDALDDDLVRTLVEKTIKAGRSIGTLNLALFTLRRNEDTRSIGEDLERKIGARRLLDLIVANGTVFELFMVVGHASPGLARELVDALDDDLVHTLVEKTIKAGRSIGTLHLALFALRRNEDTRSVGEALEHKIGARRLLDLIVANGTVFELFKVVSHASPGLARELVDALDEDSVRTLVEKTIRAGRSIGTLDLALFALRRNEDTRSIGEDLERKIGARRLLDLIVGNGTVFELFRAVQYASPGLARELVDALDEDSVHMLVEKMIKAGRSIGTLHLALFTLRRNEDTRSIGEDLERKIGARRLLKLIVANGTVFELFKVVQYASPGLACELVDALDDDLVHTLVEKTIKVGRSIGTLNLTLLALHSSAKSKHIGTELERRLGAKRAWALILGAGSPGPLVDLLRDMSPEFRIEVVSEAATLTKGECELMFRRGNLFELCELIAERPELLARQSAGVSAMTDALLASAPDLLSSSSWYERNTAARKLAKCTQAEVRDHVLGILDAELAAITVRALSFHDLNEAANALDWICRSRKSLRTEVAEQLWQLLPQPDRWMLDPRSGLGHVRLLLRVVAIPEFDSATAKRVIDEVSARMTGVIARCRTEDIMWTLWAAFETMQERDRVSPAVVKARLASLVKAAMDALTSRVLSTAGRDELSARFALTGLLALIGVYAPRATVAALARTLPQGTASGARWLCKDRDFVSGTLALRGVEIVEPLKRWAKAERLQALVAAADENQEKSVATQVLLDRTRRELREITGNARR